MLGFGCCSASLLSAARSTRGAPMARRAWRGFAAVVPGLALLLAACGGGGGGASDTGAPASCSVTDQKLWLRDYMDEWYFWTRLSPRPAPETFETLQGFFEASLYTGTDARFPKDRFSRSEPEQRFTQFYGEGRTLGYGLFVAGLEILGRPDEPLRVRYVEPQSDAALRGLQRGEQILSVNGRSAADMVGANDFGVLSPAAEGEQLRLQVRGNTGDRAVTLTAAVYTLTPVTNAAVLSSPAGRKIGYVLVKDMVAQAEGPLAAAFANFAVQGIADLVVDLRYNGGGLVSAAALLGSYAAGGRAAGQVFASLLYNERRAPANNQAFRFTQPTTAFGGARVFVLTGQRTCSASEQFINGLRPHVDVVVIGDTSCGKPVGSLPTSQCGQTYSVINFESVNSRNEGRYFDGLAPSCAVADDLSQPLGAPDEALLWTARQFADRGACPALGAAREAPLQVRRRGAAGIEPGERQDMIVR